jgi:hypothetical protein
MNYSGNSLGNEKIYSHNKMITNKCVKDFNVFQTTDINEKENRGGAIFSNKNHTKCYYKSCIINFV